MPRSLCSSTTMFYSVELLLGLFVLYCIWQESNHCITIPHDSALHSCGEQLNRTDYQSAKHLSHSLFVSEKGSKSMKSVLETRLEGLESYSCRQLDVTSLNWSTGAKYTILYLGCFFIVNSLLCVAMFFRRRLAPTSFFFLLESFLVAVVTVVFLAITIYVQHREQQQMTTVPTDLVRGISLEAPSNWIMANAIALLTLVWKAAQIIFTAVKGDRKITVEHPVFKIFDFSKNYASPGETNA